MTTDLTKGYATIRFAGDNLVPNQMKRLLKIVPALAYAKDQPCVRAAGGPTLTGRTGVWYFCTDGIVAGSRVQDHLNLLLTLFLSDTATLTAIRKLMRHNALQAVVTCFWHGPAGARRPHIPRPIAERLKLLPAAIETDFDTDDKSDRDAA